MATKHLIYSIVSVAKKRMTHFRALTIPYNCHYRDKIDLNQLWSTKALANGRYRRVRNSAMLKVNRQKATKKVQTRLTKPGKCLSN